MTFHYIDLLKKNICFPIILSGPSGSGKTTLARLLVKTYPDIFYFLVSSTTRKKRCHELQGRDYFFYSYNDFMAIKNNKGFLEYAKVYNEYYGTSLKEYQNAISLSKYPVFDIDYQGALQIRNKISHSLLIFIDIDSKAQKSRLIKRDGINNYKERTYYFNSDLDKKMYYEYIITNKDTNNTINSIYSIILSHSYKNIFF